MERYKELDKTGVDELLDYGTIPDVKAYSNDKNNNGKLYDETYDRFLQIDVTNKEGLNMYDKAIELRNDPPTYMLLIYQCSDVVDDIMSAGDKGFQKWNEYNAAPNADFRNAVAQNKNSKAWRLKGDKKIYIEAKPYSGGIVLVDKK